MLLLAAGCGSSSSHDQTSATATPSVQPTTSRNFQVSTPNGQVSVSLDGQLPPNWPTDFPLPPSAAAAGSGSLGGSSSTGHVAVFSTTTPAPAVFSYYTSNRTVTTTGAKTVGAGLTFVGSTRVTAPYTGSVTVAGRSDATYIVVVLTVPG
jgi:hypothetical protein